MLPARALAVLRGCPRGAASRGGLPRRLRTVPTACAAAPPSSAGEPGAAARLAASDAAAAALSAAQRPPADAPLRTGRRNMRDAVDSRHACPCCSNDIRGRTVRRVLRHVITPDRVYTRRKGVAARIKHATLWHKEARSAHAASPLRAETTWASVRLTWWPTSCRKARSAAGVASRLAAAHAFWLAGAWPADPFAALEAAAAGETASLATLKQLRFREGLDWEAAAARFGRGVTVSRLRGILRRDSLTIPLVQDAEPLEARAAGSCLPCAPLTHLSAQVIFEDAELLAVVKPPDLRYVCNAAFKPRFSCIRGLTSLLCAWQSAPSASV